MEIKDPYGRFSYSSTSVSPANTKIEDFRNILDKPQFLFRYVVILPPDFGDAKKVGGRVTEVEIPIPELTSAPTPIGNSNWYYVSGDDIGNITMKILEGEDHLTSRYFNKWRSKIINADGTYNPPKYYKRNIIINQLSADQKVTMTYKLIDYFPLKSTIPALSSESNEIKTLDVDFSGDSIEFSIL